MLGKVDMERWAMSTCTKFSSSWILSPPDHFGFIENNLFQEVCMTHLGQVSPAIHSYVGGFFGKRCERVDKYGANLASAALCGNGFRLLHDALQHLLYSMMRLCGINFKREAINFLFGEVSETYITRYSNHLAVRRHARKQPMQFFPISMRLTSQHLGEW